MGRETLEGESSRAWMCAQRCSWGQGVRVHARWTRLTKGKRNRAPVVLEHCGCLGALCCAYGWSVPMSLNCTGFHPCASLVGTPVDKAGCSKTRVQGVSAGGTDPAA